jgi:uncharacterized delta-60 repeat protein
MIVLALSFAVSASFGSLLDTTFNIGTGANGLVEQVLQLPDGKVLVCGNFTSFNGRDRAYIARLNNDGSVDETFDAHPGYWVRHMCVQPDGKIFIGGYFTTVQGVSRNLIARLNSDGSLDTSFDPGTGAEVKIAAGIDGNVDPFVFWIELQTDGKLIITGNFRNYNGQSRTGIARLNPDGSLDSAFDVGSGLDSWGRVIKILGNGQILVGGWFTAYHGQGHNRLVRINGDGSPDSSFNPNFGDKTAVYSIADLGNGKIIVSGHSENPDGTFSEEVAKLNADGSVDKSYPAFTNEKTECLLLQPNGKLILAGYFSSLNGAARANLGRVNADGTIDSTFSANTDNFVWTVAPGGAGKILICGGFQKVDGVARSGVARLNLPEASDGTITAPLLSAPAINQGRFEVRLASESQRTYSLQYCSDLNQPAWVSLPGVQGTGGQIVLSDGNPQSPRWYRVSVK